MNAPFIVSPVASAMGRARARAYLAIAGGIDVPDAREPGDPSDQRDGRSGWPTVKSGDRLPLGDPARGRHNAPALSESVVTLPDRHAHSRARGTTAEYFTADARCVAVVPYAIGQDSDRMGFRLEGPRLTHARGADIISDATPLGVLQVPASGQPILLMADRQTTGGYPKIATVISADISIAGQLGPGDTIAFEVCTPIEALAALIAQERAVMAIESMIS
jgi:antagonist of KipI